MRVLRLHQWLALGVVPFLFCTLDASAQSASVDDRPDQDIAAEEDSWPIHLAVGAFIASSAADTATTVHLLTQHRDRVDEANPILRPFQDQPMTLAVMKSAITVGTGYMLMKWHRTHRWQALAIALGGTAIYSACAVQNWRLNRRMRDPNDLR